LVVREGGLEEERLYLVVREEGLEEETVDLVVVGRRPEGGKEGLGVSPWKLVVEAVPLCLKVRPLEGEP
jgi:hypothetical protein